MKLIKINTLSFIHKKNQQFYSPYTTVYSNKQMSFNLKLNLTERLI